MECVLIKFKNGTGQAVIPKNGKVLFLVDGEPVAESKMQTLSVEDAKIFGGESSIQNAPFKTGI